MASGLLSSQNGTRLILTGPFPFGNIDNGCIRFGSDRREGDLNVIFSQRFSKLLKYFWTLLLATGR